MAHHCAEVFTGLELIHLDFFGVSTDNEVPVAIVFVEVDAEHFLAFEEVQVLNFGVINVVTELRVDSCAHLTI